MQLKNTKVWQYWHDPEAKCPDPYVIACMASVGRHYGAKVHTLVTRRSLGDYMPHDVAKPVRERWFEYPAHEANYVRAWLLHKYGGLWADVDYLALGRIPRLFEQASDLTSYKVAPDNMPQNSFLFGRAGTKATEVFWRDTLAGVLSTKGKLTWKQSGSESLLRVAKVAEVGYLPQKLVCPLHWGQMANLLFPALIGEAEMLRRSDGVMLFSDSMPKAIKKSTLPDLWTAPNLMGLFIRSAFFGLGAADDTIEGVAAEFLPVEIAHAFKRTLGSLE